MCIFENFEETVKELETPMIPNEIYIQIVNSRAGE